MDSKWTDADIAKKLKIDTMTPAMSGFLSLSTVDLWGGPLSVLGHPAHYFMGLTIIPGAHLPDACGTPPFPV